MVKQLTEETAQLAIAGIEALKRWHNEPLRRVDAKRQLQIQTERGAIKGWRYERRVPDQRLSAGANVIDEFLSALARPEKFRIAVGSEGGLDSLAAWFEFGEQSREMKLHSFSA